ncbi:NADPH-dependent ferric siderophore reductase, contains FAD-binding and SIP domains [Streptomyces sp. Ag82_O1-12]|uniref:siderophore-interacting protein n=1 Tax=unclassified Streptomyces TaxID=2593676 RepID=UPI000BC3AE59|nr:MULTISPECIES: siderophore-interacting protein [unclassified Streptomyces]SMQ16493.1 NADPH-dependent ferric siderophore reductase, contains FAD-binding and SIP domains [Streptomyces sp. Ag82_O1-12]SOD45522.1 NADPH-dependent ferric siderophore reductase, contains FAD-binding and SIP domains [Streptomyces sp. Ag82_G6-1]
MTTAVAAPFRFFSLQVVRTRRLGPSLVRVTFGGPDLHAFHSDGRDQSLSLFLPHPGQPEPVVPLELGDSWWQGWRELPDDVRAVMRSYTLRALRRDPDEIDIDFALHGIEPGARVQAGPASRWAARAAAGDRVLLLGPAVADNRAIRFRPPEDTDLVVVWGDETAVPAASAIVEALPAGTRARVWLEVPHADDIQHLATEADAEITWLGRDERGTEGSPAALDALRAAPLPPAERPYVWIAGESGCVKELRRHFVRERGIDRRRVTFVGYWRRGASEEQLRAEA